MDWGYAGMFAAAFIAGSVFPLSSEAVLVGLMAMGMDKAWLFGFATAGNTAGSMFNYWIGRMGKTEWISRLLRISPRNMERAERFTAGRGAWMGFFSFLPVIGEAIGVMLGLMRANVFVTLSSVTLGKALRYALLIFGAGLAMSCTGGKEEGKPVVVSSIEPLAWFAGQIGGDRFEYRVMVGQGSDPETYEPTAKQMAALSDAAMYVAVGGIGFEGAWLPRFREYAPVADFVDTSEGIAELRNGDCGDGDPHTWTSAVNARVIAANICTAMCRLQPADSATFRANLAKVMDSIARVDSMASNALGGGAFLVYHPAMTYFACDYGMEQIAVEQEGKENSAAGLHAVISQARRKGVRVMLVQKEFAGGKAETVAGEAGAVAKVVNPLGRDWPTEMETIIKALAE